MRWMIAVLSVGLLVSTTGRAVAESIDRDYDKEFTVSPGAVLHLEHGDGKVVIAPWDKDVISVQVRYRAEVNRIGIGGKHGFEVDFGQTGKTVSVIGREHSGANLGILYRKVSEHAYRIQAPAYVTLELKGEDGDVEVTGWKGDITCNLEDGALRIDDARSEEVRIDLEDGDVILAGLHGELNLECDDGDVEIADSDLSKAHIDTEDGDVRVADSKGDFVIECDDGNVRMERVRGGAVRVRTEDGDVDLHLLEAGSVEVVTEDGTAQVGLGPDVSVAFSLRTDEGEVTVDLPGIAKLHEGNHEISGEWNGGKGQLSVSTEDGDIVLMEDH